MQAHDHVVKDLNEEFKKVDRAFGTNEVRVFGRNTGQIFKELDVIRRKQLDIASDHVSLETIQDLPNPTATATAQLKKSNQDDQFLRSFERKEVMLKSMMRKLDDLTQSMDTFRKISESDYNGIDTLITSESDSSEDEGRTSKRSILHCQQHDKKKHQQQEDAFLTVPIITTTSTKNTSIL
ncbi:hypothetical protein V8B55DRAFT_1468830 [Mucor lusitanicus]|uniref:Uncharacterized protein n=1 Tax=Mucor lusitanicus CBS 277.49 TaxID=747725 RepID=A0A168J8Z5_MUCCL|nr:hypothetical protein MUCCIDRAFT_112321 [Mucor lusitanicus CBS 277.49]